ncbi:hypothetical protein AB0E63_19495 [Kribbella sp. NPDC026596]|uniref:hypothetical protein n=1 Tax=Kribbella sp. NPDC026596 TaxID=3155122 RepID=UPI0033D4D492
MATEPAESVRARGTAAAHRVATKLGIAGHDDIQTLRDAYLVAYEFPAPLMVRIADDMLADLRADVGSRRTGRVVALGRDGHSLALAMTRLDSRFVRRHVSNLVLSRALVENALQDLENHQGLKFPQVHGYRRVAPRVDPADTIGGFRVLSDYLQAHQVPVGAPHSRVTVFDTSFKGTVQELLAAAYPETTFTGRYAFFGESPHDPHPGSKKGYEVHLNASETRQGRPFYDLPAEESKTFAHQLALNSVEELLDGPMTSPVRLRANGPAQTGQRNEPALLVGLSQGLVSPRLRQLRVREGVKVVNLLAVADCAQHAASLRDSGGDYRRGLEAGAQRYRTEIRAWIGGGETDPRLKEFLDSFVHRADKQHAELLQRTLEGARVTAGDSAPIWAAYDRCASDDDKRVFVQNVLNSAQTGGGMHGRQPERRGSDQRLAGARWAERES